MVERLARHSLDKLISGEYNLDKPVVVKCYNNGCHLCHALKPIYEEVASGINDVRFFAFNMEDGEGLERAHNFEGVPTILLIKNGTVTAMPEPSNPHPKHWYHVNDIKSFIRG
jgi:thiol-disulfide isomerase/thioredoxin